MHRGFTYLDSLRGRRLKGEGKGVLCARETRGARKEATPFPSPFKRLPRWLVFRKRIQAVKRNTKLV